MEKCIAFFVIAIAAKVVVGRPQTNNNELRDRFGAIIIIPDQEFFQGNQGGNFPGQGGRLPGQAGFFPGQGGRFPGQGGTFPGQGGTFPGQGGTFPGQGGTFPGQGGIFPGQGGTFPGQGGTFPGQGGTFPGQQPTASTVAPSGTGSTTLSSTVQTCIQNCPVTPEYNPVCGTNNVLYANPGRLVCAQECGVNVSLLRASPCPATTPAPSS